MPRTSEGRLFSAPAALLFGRPPINRRCPLTPSPFRNIRPTEFAFAFHARVRTRVRNKPRAGIRVGLGLIFQGCHYELPDIKFASVDLLAVTVETPFAPSRYRAFRGFAIIISAGNVYWWPFNEYITPTWRFRLNFR